jgi:hypothetical protein
LANIPLRNESFDDQGKMQRLATFFVFIGLTEGTMEGRGEVGNVLTLADISKLARYCRVCAPIAARQTLFKLGEVVNNSEIL